MPDKNKSSNKTKMSRVFPFADDEDEYVITITKKPKTDQTSVGSPLPRRHLTHSQDKWGACWTRWNKAVEARCKADAALLVAQRLKEWAEAHSEKEGLALRRARSEVNASRGSKRSKAVANVDKALERWEAAIAIRNEAMAHCSRADGAAANARSDEAWDAANCLSTHSRDINDDVNPEDSCKASCGDNLDCLLDVDSVEFSEGFKATLRRLLAAVENNPTHSCSAPRSGRSVSPLYR